MPPRLAGLTEQPGPVWLVHHRPTWAAITGPAGHSHRRQPDPDRSRQRMRRKGARADRAQRGADAVGAHPHLRSHQLQPGRAAADRGRQWRRQSGRSRPATCAAPVHWPWRRDISVPDGLSVGGFGFLLMTRAAGRLDHRPVTTRRRQRQGPMPFTAPRGHGGRLDCPDLEIIRCDKIRFHPPLCHGPAAIAARASGLGFYAKTPCRHTARGCQ